MSCHDSQVTSGHLTQLDTHAAVPLQDNGITQTDGLSHLTALLSLDLGCNRILKVTHMSNLTMLRHLAVHDNQITSLAGMHD